MCQRTDLQMTDIVRYISSLRFYINDITQIRKCGHQPFHFQGEIGVGVWVFDVDNIVIQLHN